MERVLGRVCSVQHRNKIATYLLHFFYKYATCIFSLHSIYFPTFPLQPPKPCAILNHMTEWITFISQYGDTLTLAGLIIGLFAWLRQDMNKQEERLMGHMNKQEERLMGHINKQDERLMGHINKQGENLMGHINKLDEKQTARTDQLRQELMAHMNKLDEKQTARTDQLRQELMAHMNKLDEKQTARVDEHIKMQDNVISIIREDMSKQDKRLTDQLNKLREDMNKGDEKLGEKIEDNTIAIATLTATIETYFRVRVDHPLQPELEHHDEAA